MIGKCKCIQEYSLKPIYWQGGLIDRYAAILRLSEWANNLKIKTQKVQEYPKSMC